MTILYQYIAFSYDLRCYDGEKKKRTEETKTYLYFRELKSIQLQIGCEACAFPKWHLKRFSVLHRCSKTI